MTTPTPESSEQASRRSPRWPEIALVVALALVAAGVCLTGNFGSECWWTDAPRHMMDGVFVLDWFRDLPASLSLKQYATEYYARYPCLGLIHYPPVFPVVEGLFFAVFGVSVATARITVAAFGALGAVFGYLLARRFVGRLASTAFVLLVFGAPQVVWWSREVMLETPMIAMMLVASYFFVRYVEEGRKRFVVAAGALLALAVLTKQTASVLGPVWAIYALWRRRWRFALRWEVWAAVAILFVLLGPFAVATLTYAKVNVGQSIGSLSGGMDRSRTSWEAVSFYGRALPEQAGWLGIALVAVPAAGIVVSAARRRSFLAGDGARRAAVLGAMWTAVCWVILTFVIAHKDSRFILVWLPGLALIGAAGIESLGAAGIGRVLAWVAVCACTVRAGGEMLGLSTAWGGREAPWVRGPGVAAEQFAGVPRGTVIFYSGYENGNFIFAMRQQHPEPRAVVLRGTKMLVTLATEREHGMRVLVRKPEEVLALFRRYGVRYVVLEEPSPKVQSLDPVFVELSKLMHTDGFVRRGMVPVETNRRNRALRIEIYEVANRRPAEAADLTIELLSAGRTLRVPLTRLGVPVRARGDDAPPTRSGAGARGANIDEQGAKP